MICPQALSFNKLKAFFKKIMAKKKTKKKSNEHIYKKGESLAKISQELTGTNYKIFAILSKNGYTMENLPDGAVLKWE